MKKTLLKYFLVLVSVLALTSACKKEKIDKDGILNEQFMEEVLYDYQLAQALAHENASPDSVAILEFQYTQAVYTKHGITSEQFERSLGRYARDHKKMLALTKGVEKRYEDELKSSQEAQDAERRNKFAQQTDTLVAWENPDGVMLDANGCNQYVVSIEGSKFEGCDRVNFGVKTRWLYREGQLSATAVLSVVYDNDSIDVHTQQLRDEARTQNAFAYINQNRKVKVVKVHIFQNAQWAAHMQKLALTEMFMWGIKHKDDE